MFWKKKCFFQNLKISTFSFFSKTKFNLTGRKKNIFRKKKIGALDRFWIFVWIDQICKCYNVASNLTILIMFLTPHVYHCFSSLPEQSLQQFKKTANASKITKESATVNSLFRKKRCFEKSLFSKNFKIAVEILRFTFVGKNLKLRSSCFFFEIWSFLKKAEVFWKNFKSNINKETSKLFNFKCSPHPSMVENIFWRYW